MRVEEKVALIENRILCNAIWGDTSCLKPVPDFRGYTQASTDKVGRAFIEYCIARVLGIYRLPQCGYDNYLSNKCFYDVLDESEVDDACSEMGQIINHVQRMLVQDHRVVNGKISVVRCLSEFQIKDAATQLADKELDEIIIPVSIFSSYSYDGDITQIYPAGNIDGKHINIKEDIPIKDIVLWDCYVGNGRQTCAYVKSMVDCERELWVVDRSINGKKTLNRSCFHYTDGLPYADSRFRNYTYGSDKPIHAGCFQKRPCEYEDVLTKLVISRNNKRIQKEDQLYKESIRA